MPSLWSDPLREFQDAGGIDFQIVVISHGVGGGWLSWRRARNDSDGSNVLRRAKVVIDAVLSDRTRVYSVSLAGHTRQGW